MRESSTFSKKLAAGTGIILAVALGSIVAHLQPSRSGVWAQERTPETGSGIAISDILKTEPTAIAEAVSSLQEMLDAPLPTESPSPPPATGNYSQGLSEILDELDPDQANVLVFEPSSLPPSGGFSVLFTQAVESPGETLVLAEKCWGGADDPFRLSGASVDDMAGGALLTAENSAILRADTLSSISCTGFLGGSSVPPPRRIVSWISWGMAYPAAPFVPEISVPPATMENETRPPTEGSLPHPTPTPPDESRPTQESPSLPSGGDNSFPALFLRLLSPLVYAQILPPPSAPEANPVGLETVFAEVSYAWDGEPEKVLGTLRRDNVGRVAFPIPAATDRSDMDVSRLRITVRGLPLLDEISPDLYLDSIWLQVSTDEPGSEALYPPDAARGDVLLSEVRDGEWRAQVVLRNPLPTPVVPVATGSGAIFPLRDEVPVSDPTPLPLVMTQAPPGSASWVRELWLLHEPSGGWTRVADDSIMAAEPGIRFSDGQLFWVGTNDGALWRFHPAVNATDSASLSGSGTIVLEYATGGGERRRASYDVPSRLMQFTVAPIPTPSP